MRSLIDKELERSVLAGLLLLPDALVEHGDSLKADHFATPDHRAAFEALTALFISGQSTDAMTLRRELILRRANDITPDLVLTHTSREKLEAHASRLIDLYRDRELTSMAAGISSRVGGGEPGTLDYAMTELTRIADGTIRAGAVTFEEIGPALITGVEAARESYLSGQPLPGSVSVGIHALDNLTGGFFTGEMWVIAARPGMGKSTFSRQVARNAARSGIPVHIVSREMPTMQIGRLLASHEAAVNSNSIRTGKSTDEEVSRFRAAVRAVSRWPVSIDDRSGSLTEIVFSTKRWRMRTDRSKPAILIVDYLQLIANSQPGRNREGEVSEISRTLKAIAIEQNVLIFSLSQLSRAVETRGGMKIPQLSDLRESGAIEQDADGVLFLYNGWKYDETANPNHFLLIVAKSRESQTGAISMHGDMPLGAFSGWDTMYHGPDPKNEIKSNDYEF